ncbi:MAG: 5-formyltetrahydrofolate cyclo-ligase [Actinobacteria bacterium]|nr:5-formyltetrahydrofolate cyclo-ligase [Actinomycetota bacterium]MCG2800863.1 5-formyltetrahydrofolate cyclo-ligase [Cellulomonas sp.]
MQTEAQPYPHAQQGDEPEDLKQRFRSAIRAERAKLSPRRRLLAGEGISHVVLSIPAVQGARTVAAYVARADEPPTGPLIEALAQAGVRVLLPVLGEGLSRCWAPYTGADELVVRAPGRPPEPPGPPLAADAVADADVVVVPALAVDTSGARIGQGAGWYDRVLPLVGPEAMTVAVVFTSEVYDALTRPLPSEPHDRSVRAVATPQYWLPLGDPAAGSGPTAIP